MTDRNRELFYKEHIKKRGYTLQGELGYDETTATYHVEYGTGYVLQFVKYFFQEKYAAFVKKRVEDIQKMTVENPDLFLCYIDREELGNYSEYEAEMMLKIQYGLSLKRYLGSRSITLKELLEMGIAIAKAQEICDAYQLESPRIDRESIFFIENEGWKMGNFRFDSETDLSKQIQKGSFGLPPEYYTGTTSDQTSKVYELGILLYSLLNDMELPFEDECQNEWEAEHMRRKSIIPKAPKYGTDGLKQLICHACSLREHRYRTMREFREHLEYFKHHLPQEWLISEIAGHSYKDKEYIDRELKPVKHSLITSEDKIRTGNGVSATTKSEEQQTIAKKKEEARKKKERKALEKEKKRKQKENEKKLTAAKKEQKKAEKLKYGNQDRKDLYMIIGIVGVFVLTVVLFITIVGNSKNQKLYAYMDSAAYGKAMEEMEALYEDGQNVDEVTEYFIQRCMEEREYKRISPVLYWLSEEYCEMNEALFEEIVTQMLASGKEKRAEEVIETMENCGGIRAEYTLELRKLYEKAIKEESF